MSTKIKIRRDILENWQSYNPVLADGELALVKDTKELKVGDGVTPFMNLEGISGGGGVSDLNGYVWECIFEVKEGDNVPTQTNLDINDSERLMIHFNCNGQPNSNVFIRYNNDSEGNVNYLHQYLVGRDGNAYANKVNHDKIPIYFTTGIFDWFGKMEIDLNSGDALEHKGYFYQSYRYVDINMYKYKGQLPINKVTLYADENTNNVNIKIYKLVQIVSQAPYKKLVASASKIRDIDGLVINVNQDKKYEIELIGDFTNTDGYIEIYCNNDQSNNYTLSFIGVYSDGKAHAGIETHHSVHLLDAYRGFSVFTVKFYPTVNMFHKYLFISNPVPIDYKHLFRYKGGTINTLNFTAPNSDIPCEFKVWEITE